MCPGIEIAAFVAIGVVHEHYGSESALMKHLPHGLTKRGPLFQHETEAEWVNHVRLLPSHDGNQRVFGQNGLVCTPDDVNHVFQLCSDRNSVGGSMVHH